MFVFYSFFVSHFHFILRQKSGQILERVQYFQGVWAFLHRGTNSAKTVGVCDRIFVGVVLTRNGGENRRIFAFFTAVAVTPKATRRKAGVSTTCRQSQHKRIQNAEFRMQNQECTNCIYPCDGNYSKKEDCLNGKHQKTLGKTQRDR